MKISTKICIKNDKKQPNYCKICTKNQRIYRYEFCARRKRETAGNCFPAGVSWGFGVYDMVMR